MTSHVDENPDNPLTHGQGSEPLLRATSWQRTSLLVMVSLLAYVAVNVFWQYLSSGDWSGSIVCSMFGKAFPIVPPLGEILYRPLSVFLYPWMILVIGLLLGIVMFVPVVVAVLYRLPVAVVFLLVTALVGNAPVLALTLAVGCFLAAATPLRSNMSVLATVLGLSPVALYLVLAGFISGDSASILPVQRWIPYAPVCVALATALVAACAVLGLAKLTNYRPGVVSPVLLILSAAPFWVFYSKIGTAELGYSLIVNRLASSSSIFDPARVEVWSRENRVVGLDNRKLRNFVQDAFDHKRRDLAADCDRFLDRHPRSQHVPAMLYLKAQCQSLQLDDRAFEGGTIRLTDAYVLPLSGGTWQQLLRDHPSSAQAALAQWRLGELAIREGKVRDGRRALSQAEEALQNIVSAQPKGQDVERALQLFMPLPPLPDGPQYEQALLEVRKLLWLMDQNDVLESPEAAEALAAWMNCNPCLGDERGPGGLCRLLTDKPQRQKTKLGNNIRLAIAEFNNDIPTIVAVAADKSDADAAVAANFELGRMVMQKPILMRQWSLLPAEEYFKRVLEMPASPWRDQASQLLGRPTQ